MTLIAPGRCRHCGCTDELQCRLHRHAHDEFAWTDAERTVCNGRECQRAEVARKAIAAVAAREAKPKSRFSGMGYGAIVAKLRREERARRRRKGRAA